LDLAIESFEPVAWADFFIMFNSELSRLILSLLVPEVMHYCRSLTCILRHNNEAAIGFGKIAEVKLGKSYLQETCGKRSALEFALANLVSLSPERQHDQWCEQDYRCSGECS
jgi:hypothetical protein